MFLPKTPPYLKLTEDGNPFTSIQACKCCGKYFLTQRRGTCSERCKNILIRSGALASVAKQTRRSKDEIKLFELLLPHFIKITNNDTSIANGWDADILIYDTKTAILWNGPWHYKEMGFGKHSLKQVQNRDRLK